MRQVGVFEAKNRLSALLALVENGEEIIITRHGQPVARLVAAKPINRAGAGRAVETIRNLRVGQALGSEKTLDLIASGRRY